LNWSLGYGLSRRLPRSFWFGLFPHLFDGLGFSQLRSLSSGLFSLFDPLIDLPGLIRG
jgi:hypothetical protein